MKNKLAILSTLVVLGLLIASCTVTQSDAPHAIQVFPTPTNHFLLQGKPPLGTSDSPVSSSGVPTIASVFRAASSTTPPPVTVLTAAVTTTPIPESTETQPPIAQFSTVKVFDDVLNLNFEVQKDTRMSIDLKSSSERHGGDAAISFAPRRRGDATLFISVSEASREEYPRDQLAKLSFWLYSPKSLLYLDQFFITFVGSKSLPYWSPEDQKVANFLSVFHQISLEEVGFDRAIPADTWVMVEIDLNKVRALAPEYQYLTGISFQNATDPTRPLLIDDISLTLLSQPPKRPILDVTPTASSN